MYKTFKQADSRWGSKNYDGSSMANSGCGPTAVADLAYAVNSKITPWTVAKWMKEKGYAVKGWGTAWDGIPAAMKHFGLKDVKNVEKMTDIYDYLKKGYCAVFLMSSGSRGGVTWTTSGHFIAVTGYKYQNKKHYFYTRDPGFRNHDGWFCYETQMKGLIPQVWVGRVGEAKPKKPKYKVIDVSEHQGNIDWKKVKADGVVGAIIRYADGNHLDPCFDKNMKNAKAAGLHIGAYIYSRAKTKAGAEKEATRLFNACKKYSPDLPLYIDLEASNLSKYANTVANAFIAKMKALGGFAGVYANLNWWNNYLTKVTPPARWVAQYKKGITKCEYNGPLGMWQYSNSGKVSGIKGRVDMDWLYVKYWEKKPTPPTPPKKTNAQKIVDKAKEFAYAYGTKKAVYSYPGGKPKDAYKKGLQTAYGDRKGWGKQTKAGASCDVFVGTVIRCSGVDPKFPRGLDGVLKHLKGNSKWTLTAVKSESKMKPGDVIYQEYKGSGGHIFIYLGGGKIANAHYNGKTYGIIENFSTTKAASKCSIYNVYRAK